MTPLTQPNWRYLEIVISQETGLFGLRLFKENNRPVCELTWEQALEYGQMIEDQRQFASKSQATRQQ